MAHSKPRSEPCSATLAIRCRADFARSVRRAWGSSREAGRQRRRLADCGPGQLDADDSKVAHQDRVRQRAVLRLQTDDGRCTARAWSRIQDVILNTETPDEILSDRTTRTVALEPLPGRHTLKYRDVWDVWFLLNRLGATPNREIVVKKFADYKTSDVTAKAKARLSELAQDATATSLLRRNETASSRSARVAQMSQMGLQRTIAFGQLPISSERLSCSATANRLHGPKPFERGPITSRCRGRHRDWGRNG